MATEDSLDIFGSDPFGRDYLYGLGDMGNRQGLAPYGFRYAENLSQPTTTKKSGYLGDVGGYLGDIGEPRSVMSELSASSEIGGRTVQYPLIVPTLTAQELMLLHSGGKPTPEIYDKAKSWAVSRLAQGQDPFANPVGLRYPQSQGFNSAPSTDRMQELPDGLFNLAKRFIPAPARFYAQTMLGDKTKPLTQNDLTPEELSHLNEAINYSRMRLQAKYETIKNAKSFNELPKDIQNKITSSEDYLKFDIGGKTPEEANLKGKNLSDFLANALQQAKTKAILNQQQFEQGFGNVQYQDYPAKNPIRDTLGRFNYKINPDGTINVLDSYDFANQGRQQNVEDYAKMTPTEKALSLAKSGFLNIGLPNYIEGMAGKFGEAYIGADGRPVNITYKPSMLPQQNGTIEQQPMYSDPFGNTIGSSIR